jgi:hypothetical protein
MREKELKNIFCENLEHFKKSINWLKISYNKCSKIDLSSGFDGLEENEIESLEALSNRFTRAIDILLHKVLKSLDIIELEDVSRSLDIVIRAEKRNLVEDYNYLIELKDLRNELSHEYIEDYIVDKYKEILKNIPAIVLIYKNIVNYSKKFGYCIEKQ